MCIVIDTNALASVFNKSCDSFHEFFPVWNWIINGNGFVVFGGSHYRKELSKAYRYLRLLRELKNIRKAIEVKQDLVDEKETELLGISSLKTFNDQHIIAIFCISKCRLFCSDDKRADKYIKNKSYYPKGHKRPKIYRSLKNKSLINDKYIVQIQNLD